MRESSPTLVTQALDSRSHALQREDRKDHARPGVIAALAGSIPAWQGGARTIRRRLRARPKRWQRRARTTACKWLASILWPWMFQETPAAAALRHPLQAVELVPGLKSVLFCLRRHQMKLFTSLHLSIEPWW